MIPHSPHFLRPAHAFMVPPEPRSGLIRRRPANDPPPSPASGIRRRARSTRHRRAGQCAIGIRLEAIQGPAHRGQLPALAARRRGARPHQGLPGPDWHQRRLRADPRTAAAPQGGARDGQRPSQLRRGQCRHARAEEADREGEVDGGPAALHRRLLADCFGFRSGRFQQAVDGGLHRPRRQDQRAAAQSGSVHPVLQQGTAVGEGLQRAAEDVRRNDEHVACADRSVEGRVRLRRARTEERQRRPVRQHPARLEPGNGHAGRQETSDRHAGGDRRRQAGTSRSCANAGHLEMSGSTGTNARPRSVRAAARCGGTASASPPR